MGCNIRNYDVADTAELAELFFQSVRFGTRNHYSRRQREAWAPSVPEIARWQARLSSLNTFVAEVDKEIAGFITLGEDGHIDLAYVRPELIGQGVAHKLYVALELAASRIGLKRLFTEASETAKPFFERQGWRLVESQTIQCSGVSLTNHRMEKLL